MFWKNDRTRNKPEDTSHFFLFELFEQFIAKKQFVFCISSFTVCIIHNLLLVKCQAFIDFYFIRFGSFVLIQDIVLLRVYVKWNRFSI